MKVKLTILILINCIFQLHAQSTHEELTEALQGTWVIDTVVVDYEMSEAMMKVFVDKLQEIKNSTFFKFFGDGKCEKTSSTGVNKGQWKFSEDGLSIIVKMLNGIDQRINISSIVQNHLEMTPLDATKMPATVSLVKTTN